MRLLCSSDFHGSMPDGMDEALEREPDALLMAGDLEPHPWDEDNMDELLEGLKELDIPIFAVTGNMDDPVVFDEIAEDNPNFHYMAIDKAEIGDYTVAGFSFHSMPMLFNFDNLIDRVYGKVLEDCDPEKTIVLQHVPPKGVLDLSTGWGFEEHAGDERLNEVIDEFEPFLVVCGHIHEDSGMEKVGDTTVVNVSEELVLIELNGEPEVEFL